MKNRTIAIGVIGIDVAILALMGIMISSILRRDDSVVKPEPAKQAVMNELPHAKDKPSQVATISGVKNERKVQTKKQIIKPLTITPMEQESQVEQTAPTVTPEQIPVGSAPSGEPTNPVPTEPAPKPEEPEPVNTPEPASVPEPTPVPVEKSTERIPTTLEIFSPIAGKGLNRTYIASQGVKGEENYIELGAVLRDQNGEIMEDQTVAVEATDATQNKTLAGTGDFSPKVNGKYYAFHYEFRQVGTHVITYSCLGVSQSVTLEVQMNEAGNSI